MSQMPYWIRIRELQRRQREELDKIRREYEKARRQDPKVEPPSYTCDEEYFDYRRLDAQIDVLKGQRLMETAARFDLEPQTTTRRALGIRVI